MIAPSGRQLEIHHGDQHVVVVEVGGGLRSFTVGGRDLLDGYRVDEMAGGGRGQVLAPWPNRIQDGHYTFDGQEQQLPLSEAARRNAIHGLVRWVPWTVVAHDPQRVVVEHLLHPQPGYPHLLELRVGYSLADDGLTVTTTATNLGADACPYGSGSHPYLTLGTETVDSLVLTSPAREVLTSDHRAIPDGRHAVEGTAYDFRSGRLIGELSLDHAFTALDRGPDGRATVTLHDPAGGRTAELWVDAAYGHLMVFTGDTLPEGHRRRGIAVEPMTCPPNAFRTGEDVIRLEPGASVSTLWGLRELEQP